MPKTPVIDISGRQVGGGARCFVIAEVAQAHDGSLGFAHSFVDAVADAGADAVKFQTHIATAESTLDEAFRVPLSGQDATRFDYWRRMEFSPEHWADLADHAAARGLVFLSSAFSVAAVELLAALEMPAWKVGSGEVFDTTIIDAMCRYRQPILLSTGMSSFDDIAFGVEAIRARSCSFALLQCTSRYPTPLEQVGLNVIHDLRQRFDCPSGLSDHTGMPYPALAAMAEGADLVEVHVTFDRRMYGPDVPASLTFTELTELCRARDAFKVMRDNPVDKAQASEALAPTRQLFSKSVCVTTPLPAGTVLGADDLTVKKPGTGIPASERSSLVGRRLKHAVVPERLLSYDDLE